MIDDVDLDELVIRGHPWHGIVNGGTLTTTVGGIERTYTQPDSGDCWLVKAPDVPEVTRTPEQLAIDEAAGAQWINYALLPGWYYRQVYGKQMSAGADSNQMSIYLPKVNYGWSMRANLSGAGAALSGNLIFSRLHLDSTEQQTVAINQAVVWPFSTGAHWEMVAKNADGTKVVIGLWSANAYGTSNPLNYKHGFPNQRARAKVNESTSSGIWATRYTRVIAPFQYVLLTIAGGTDEVPAITVTPSLLYSFTDTEKVIKNNVTVTPFDRIDLYFVYDGANYSYQEVAAGSPSPGGTLVQNSLPKNTGVFESETETIVGVYFDLTTGNLKTVKVRAYTNNSQTWSYDYGTPSPTFFNFRRDNTATESGTIKLEIDGTVVSTVTFTASWTAGEIIDSGFGHVSYVAGSTTGAADIDGTAFYGETKAMSNPSNLPMYCDLKTREGTSGNLIGNSGWLTIDAHGLEYASGAFGLVLDLNMVPPTGGMARTIVAGGVASVVTKTRGATIGVVATSGGYVNYVYENIKISHHPVTGDILQNAGAWV